MVQVIFLVCMVPIMTLAASWGFEAVVVGDAVSRVLLTVINQVVTYFVIGISPWRTLVSLKEPIAGTAVMSVFALATYGHVSHSWGLVAVDMVACVLVYFAVCMMLPKSRGLLMGVVRGAGLTGFQRA